MWELGVKQSIVITRYDFENHPRTKQLLAKATDTGHGNVRMILLGGTSKMPIVKDTLKESFRARRHLEIVMPQSDPQLMVTRGPTVLASSFPSLPRQNRGKFQRAINRGKCLSFRDSTSKGRHGSTLPPSSTTLLLSSDQRIDILVDNFEETGRRFHFILKYFETFGRSLIQIARRKRRGWKSRK